MTTHTVVGLYHMLGTAEDVRNRLRTEGVPDAAIILRRLRDVAPLPRTMAAEIRGYAGDPYFGNFILKKFGDPVPNGETAVCVAAESEAEVGMAVNTMRLFIPVRIEVLSADEIETYLKEERQKPPPL